MCKNRESSGMCANDHEECPFRAYDGPGFEECKDYVPRA
jgi:hypothetical protein